MLRCTLPFCLLTCSHSYPLVSPLETLQTGNPNDGVLYFRIDLSPEEASRICLSLYNETIQEGNNVLVSPFVVYVTVQQPFKPLWPRLLLYGHEQFRVSMARCFKSLLMSLLVASEEFLSSSLLICIYICLVPARLIRFRLFIDHQVTKLTLMIDFNRIR